MEHQLDYESSCQSPGFRFPRYAAMHLVIVSHILALLNRLYAHYSFIVNYALYAILWIFLRGAPPNRDATVNRAKGWSPGVFVACSEGPVGTALVLQLAKEGYTVHAGVSSIDEGEKLVRRWKNLGSSNGGTVRPVVYDISDPLSIRRAADNLQTYDEAHSHRRLVSVICNPGSMIVSPFHSLHDEQIDVSRSSPNAGLDSCSFTDNHRYQSSLEHDPHSRIPCASLYHFSPFETASNASYRPLLLHFLYAPTRISNPSGHGLGTR